MDDLVYLHGVALANYRGIGGDVQRIGPFKRFNFFIGPNNAGKSCVLNFIANHLKSWVWDERNSYSGRERKDLDPLDVHLGATRHQVTMGLAMPVEKCFGSLREKYPNRLDAPEVGVLIANIFKTMAVENCLWLERKAENGNLSPVNQELIEQELKQLGDPRSWQLLWAALTNQGDGNFLRHWFPQTCQAILSATPINTCEIAFIPAIRQISAKGHSFNDLSGQGLIDELARLQNPGVLEREKLSKFERINQFLKTVTEHSSARIEIPHDRESVLVHMDNKVLPLASLGTGIHEVVMLAAFCTLRERQIVCIEEPEIHLHPVLQRRLIEYLEESTDNQYFIATHSASFIDMPGAAVFHVSNKDGQTKVETAIDASSKFDICRDLGYKASDILQANAVIWVEGPSDRIYLRHWIKAFAPELREGIDYSIMFYGGRLLSHLSTDDPDMAEDDVQSLISVRRLNRHLVVVIDSDKDRLEKPINVTKQRILDSLKDSSTSIGWLTEGREIENYVEESLMTEALKASFPSFSARSRKGQFDHVLHFKNKDGQLVKNVDKVKVARKICEMQPDLDVLDLRERINELVTLIRQANR